MKINTIHKNKTKKKENEQAEFQRNTFALNKFTSKNYSLVHAMRMYIGRVTQIAIIDAF